MTAVAARCTQQLATRPRLFHVTNKRRGFVVIEEVTYLVPQVSGLPGLLVASYSAAAAQDDLLGDDVMILDAENIAFVWIGEASGCVGFSARAGHESAKEEQDGGFQACQPPRAPASACMQAALKYLAKREGKPAEYALHLPAC